MSMLLLIEGEERPVDALDLDDFVGFDTDLALDY